MTSQQRDMTFKTRQVTKRLDSWAKRLVGAQQNQSRQVDEAWLETAVDDHWMAAYRLVAGRFGEPIVAEVRVFPLERSRGRPAGAWSAEILGVDAPAPEGAIPADVLRSLKVTQYREFSSQFGRWLLSKRAAPYRNARPKKGQKIVVRLPPHVLEQGTFGKRRRGRPGRKDSFYADVARRYTEALAAGSRQPIADLAKQLNRVDRETTNEKARDMVRKARTLGFLSRTTRGRLGGELTDEAQTILRAKQSKVVKDKTTALAASLVVRSIK